MSDWLAVAGRVAVRAPTAADEREYLTRMRASAALHRPWVAPPRTPRAFAEYLKRSTREDFHAYLLVRREDGALVGAATITPIDDAPPTRGWLAFHALVPHDAQGYMSEGLHAVLDHTFDALRLQRVEADVQPGNTRSLALLARVGFRCEGASPRHLQIDGRRRDHERWAIFAEERREVPSAGGSVLT